MRARSMLLLLPLLALCGAAQAVTAPPLNLYWLQPLAWAPVLSLLSRLSGRQAALAGWVVGASANAAIFAWLVPTVTTFTPLPTLGGAAVLALFSLAFGFYGAVFGWGAAAVRRVSGRLWPLGLATWLVGCEYLNPQLFPYQQGVAWYQLRELFLTSALTGVAGVSFLVFAAAGLLAAAGERVLGIAREVGTLSRSLAGFAALLVLALGFSAQRAARIDAVVAASPSRSFALIQPNLDVRQTEELNRAQPGAARADLLKLTAETLDAHPGAEIVVWAEGALRGNPLHPVRAEVPAFFAARGVTLWSGVVEGRGRKPHRTRHNGAYRLSPDGTLSLPYDKNILVPFGEYMPLVRWLPALRQLRDFPAVTPGDAPAILAGPEAPPVGFLVCYEATRARYVREVARAGAQVLATVTYDGWFGDTAALDQHMMLAASMSALTGRPQVRAAATGISMATGPDGILLGQTRRSTREALVVDVPMASLDSPYLRFGEWFARLCVLLGFGLAVLGSPPLPPLRRLRARAAPVLFLLAAPLAWAINPHIPGSDQAVWTAAAAMVLFGPLRAATPGAPSGPPAAPPGPPAPPPCPERAPPPPTP